MNQRTGQSSRKTKETDITLTLNLDGEGRIDIDTGVGFFDHMLELFAVHGRFDLTVKCTGDTHVDAHHTVEDIGIVMGKLITKLLGDKRGINRYAERTIPMDDALVRVVLDISGRPYLSYNATLSDRVGGFDTELAEEFFRAVSTYGLITLHIDQLNGHNTHHIIEASFKAFGRALKEACTVVSDYIPSSKGMLEQ